MRRNRKQVLRLINQNKSIKIKPNRINQSINSTQCIHPSMRNKNKQMKKKINNNHQLIYERNNNKKKQKRNCRQPKKKSKFKKIFFLLLLIPNTHILEKNQNNVIIIINVRKSSFLSHPSSIFKIFKNTSLSQSLSVKHH